MAIEIEGLKELEDKLLTAEAKTGISMIRKALSAGAREVVKSAKQKVPVGTGALKRSIGIATRKGRYGTAVATALIGPKTKSKAGLALANRGRSKPIKGIFYGHIVEKGSKKAAPHPFMRPALDENVDDVILAFVNRLRKEVDSLGSGK